VTIADAQQLMTVGEAANWLRCSPDCVYDAVRREEIPAIRVGRLIRIPRSELLKLSPSSLNRTDSAEATLKGSRMPLSPVPSQPRNQEMQL